MNLNYRVMMTYLGKSHNLWHRVTLQLEQAVIDQQLVDGAKKKWETVDCYDFEPDNSPQQVCYKLLLPP